MAAEGWAMFLKKAEFGVRLVGDLISSQGRQNGPESPAAPSHGPAGATNSGAQGTLLPTDMEAVWRGPAARRAGG